jgi:hypothetical protein
MNSICVLSLHFCAQDIFKVVFKNSPPALENFQNNFNGRSQTSRSQTIPMLKKRKKKTFSTIFHQFAFAYRVSSSLDKGFGLVSVFCKLCGNRVLMMP